MYAASTALDREVFIDAERRAHEQHARREHEPGSGDTAAPDAIAARYDVVIVGAGIAGCAAAMALSRADVSGARSILVIDLHRGFNPRFSGELIHPRGAAVLDELGFTPALIAAGAVEVEGFSVYEHADNQSAVELSYAMLSGRSTGIAAHHRTLITVMRDQIARRPGVSLREGVRVVDLVRSGDAVTGVVVRVGAREQTIAADVIIAADGKASPTRKLAGIADGRRSLGFTVGVEIRDPAVPNPMAANVLLGAPGPMLCYPIERRGGHLVSRLTIDLPHDLPAKGSRLVEYLLDAFVPYLPRGLGEQAARELLARAASGKLEMAPTFDLPAPPATLPGLALIGDAAGCSHPITASGMTMGLLDAHHLGQIARECALSRDAGTRPWLDARALRRYRSAHDRYVPTRQALADAIYEAFRGEGEGERAIRRALFAYWRAGERNRRRSLALLACAEARPRIFVSEYMKTAGHALSTCVQPRHARAFPLSDRARQVRGALGLARDKLGLVAKVAWAQWRPEWLTP